ncbi:hypothetical protein [Apilactobacillus timberlakei]|uniref:Transcriptional regulator n=1 Tax=Apilactobacillus timberlakei TaxID=2008380 RepID=A0ABY2YRT1_9LACO|nr:hypothetical protein [Apilactobacillus timberlakei]TPR12756.1 hypothetical protein DY048_07030 [Apilactobacillus timberlakei]TPR13639.1 hypothetical protein DY052_07900 [Apilactobacillus timberlakei]
MKDERIEQAILILDEYQKQHKIEKQRKLAISAVEYTGMPSGSNKGNPSENKVVSGISATQFCETVRATVNSLDSQLYTTIINRRYLNGELCHSIYNDVGLSEPTFFRKQNKALLNFYEMCPLIVNKKMIAN